MHFLVRSERSIMGWNGPIFQFAGKPQELQLGPAEFEFGIQIGGVLVVNVQVGRLLVASVGRSRFACGRSPPSSSP